VLQTVTSTHDLDLIFTENYKWVA
jgi:hypothetical protein